MPKKVGNVSPLTSKQQSIKKRAEKNQLTISEVLLKLSDDARSYFVTESEEVFATIPINKINQTVDISSSTFKQWLRNQYYIIFKKPVSNSHIQEVIDTICAREVMGSKAKKKIHFRICEEKGKLFIDLINDNQDVIEISESGWNMKRQQELNIHFERPNTSNSIQKPIGNGDLSKLRKYIPLEENDYKLVLSFIIGCFMPDGPYPILILQGSQGSGKSTLSKIIKSIVDPSVVMAQSPPKKEKDLFVAASYNHLLVFDNLSGIDSRMSDALCKLSTGIAMVSKKLFTDKDQATMTAKKPLILNGIDYIAKRSDLADRSIIINLPKMSSESVQAEKDLWKNFYNDLPDILGGICDVLSVILRDYNSIKLEKNSRMADFVKWVTAAESWLGYGEGEFIKCYEANKSDAALESLEQNLLAYSIYELVKSNNKLRGNSTSILKQLRDKLKTLGIEPKENWIAANKLKDSITRVEPILNRLDIYYEYKRGKERTHILYKKS
ncbi:hypothetical protein [Lentibacillus cibarius]|uniref:ATP-binding protein n=1 Tax=Lentibacillus cibarius TaxID=2583219 RepID=A0A5S3QJA2_9BACI|nr:hypothetical protein [Lentibacillus cibarius]TMN21918.1 hypothetical protein FFL34_07160 [Lentibacillus cibarius]